MRDELVRAAERRVLYAALWDRSTADELRATLPPDAFDGPAAAVWALVEHHDATVEAWPASGPATSSWSGPGRVLAVQATALALPAVAPSHDAHATSLAAARRLVLAHGLTSVVVMPPGGWPVDLDTACRVLALAPAYRSAALTLAQLDAIAHSLTSPGPAR
ncbi:hypothetical protein [Cellulosimicrobium cellulans]|uniref:hypothetical protein n=1 Tax=Cellulosimicrobium cellulans TaxID=1710 RepID=UPI002404D7C8|nr:hypothetical protein [Cellulosimicrobium cellulans]MDF9876165.1 hypothetical protein [Cellulosimicrobium cellulans]